MVSTSFGVGVLLLLVTFAAHVLLNLWLTSAVDAVANDLATDLATSGATDAQLPAVASTAIMRARAALGAYGDDVDLDLVERTPDRIVVHVHAPGMSLLPTPLGDLIGMGDLDRRIAVRREEPDA